MRLTPEREREIRSRREFTAYYMRGVDAEEFLPIVDELLTELDALRDEHRVQLKAVRIKNIELQSERDALKDHWNRAVALAAVFQPGGRFDRVLTLGQSTVIDGMKWLIAQVDALRAERAELQQHLTALKSIRCHCTFDGETLKEECAFHKALRAERDALALKVSILRTEVYNAD